MYYILPLILISQIFFHRIQHISRHKSMSKSDLDLKLLNIFHMTKNFTYAIHVPCCAENIKLSFYFIKLVEENLP